MINEMITIRNRKELSDCLILPLSDYNGLCSKLKEALLMFYDEVSLGVYNQFKNSSFAFLGVKQMKHPITGDNVKWEAMNVFNIEEWIVYYRENTFITHFIVRQKTIEYQFNHAKSEKNSNAGGTKSI